MVEILKDPKAREYLKQISGKENLPAIDFLHELVAASFLKGDSGEVAYEEFGREILGTEALGTDEKRERHCGELADVFLAGMQRVSWRYKQKSFDGVDPQTKSASRIDKVWLKVNWAFDLKKSFHSLEGHIFPLTYNSYRQDNQNIPLWGYDETVRVAAGPSQTCGEGMHSALFPQRQRKGRILYHNLQSPVVEGETERYAQLLSMREEVLQDSSRRTEFNLFTTPFIGKFENFAFNSDPSNASREGVPDFVTVDAANLAKDNGYFIPPDVLTTDEVKEASATTQALMKQLVDGSEHWRLFGEGSHGEGPPKSDDANGYQHCSGCKSYSKSERFK